MQRTAAPRSGALPYSTTLRPALLCVAGLAVAMSAHAETLDAATQSARTGAVAIARAGDPAKGLAELTRLHAEHPENRALLYDLIAVAGWAGANAEVLDLGLPLGPAGTPDFVQMAVAKAARNVQHFDAAIEWYAQAATDRPADTQARLGLLLAYADRGDREGVTATLATFDRAEQARDDVQLARAYALRATGAALEALDAYDRVLAARPNQTDALRGKALTLRSLLLPTQALALVHAHPGILSEAEVARLKVDELAVRARLTARTPYPEPLATAKADAIASALETFDAQGADMAARRALAFDRVVALADANRAAEAVTVFESTPGALDAAQPYVLRAAADAYLQAERPEDAYRVLEAGLHDAPDDLELNFALVYTDMDLQRFDDALSLSRTLVGELPVTNRQPGSAVAKGNEEHMRAELLAGVTEAYGDQLAAAQRRFEGLLAQAPNNPHVRHELANVYHWRGWLDRSLFEYRQVLAVEPDLLSARLGYATSELDARDFAAVETTVAELSASHPRDPATERLAERWRIHNLSELDVAGSSGRSSGTTFGSESYTVDTRWFTRPQRYRYRGFVHLHDAFAAFPEGDARRTRAGLGVEYRLPRWTASGEVTGARSGGSAGFIGQTDWRIADTWSLAGLVELDSDDVPLRGHRAGVEADQVGTTVRWAPSELAGLSVGWRELSLSDDNRQRSVFADGRYRFVNRPSLKLDVTGTVSASRARRSDVTYFSPSRDIAVWGGVSYEQRLHRRYERSLVQQVALRTGRYDQAGFPAGTVWELRYDLDWHLSQRLGLGVGATRSAQYYDGALERSTGATFNVNARF